MKRVLPLKLGDRVITEFESWKVVEHFPNGEFFEEYVLERSTRDSVFITRMLLPVKLDMGASGEFYICKN